MINSYQDERITIESHFKSKWGATTPVLFENNKKSPPKTGNWVRFQLIDSEKTQKSIGTSQLHRNTGQVIIQIFVKRGEGLGESFDLSDMAINVFDVVQLDSIQFRAGYRIAVGEVGEEWYQTNVIIPFYRNSIVNTN